MSGCAIAFVVVKAVVRILFVELEHEAVTGDFSDDGGGCNGEAEGVAFDDGSIGSINVFESEDAANNANQQVRKEVGNSASDMLQHVETKVWRILYEDHPRRSTDT